MTKKEKILFSYIANIIEDERPTDVFIETGQDISKLLKRIEKLNIETLTIAPNIENIPSKFCPVCKKNIQKNLLLLHL